MTLHVALLAVAWTASIGALAFVWRAQLRQMQTARARRPFQPERVTVTTPREELPDLPGDEWKKGYEPDDTGAPGYHLPGSLRVPAQTGPPVILNGCPRCDGMVSFRRRDLARYCWACDRTFFPMSPETVMRALDLPAAGD